MIKKILVVFILLLTINVYAVPKENDTNTLNVTRFDVIGYDINFDINKYDYTITIPNIISKLSIIVEGENLEVIGDGSVDITGLDKVVVIIKNSEIEQDYTINLIRQDLGVVNINDDTNNPDIDIVPIILLVVSIVLLIVTSILIILLKRKREKEIEII